MQASKVKVERNSWWTQSCSWGRFAIIPSCSDILKKQWQSTSVLPVVLSVGKFERIDPSVRYVHCTLHLLALIPTINGEIHGCYASRSGGLLPLLSDFYLSSLTLNVWIEVVCVVGHQTLQIIPLFHHADLICIAHAVSSNFWIVSCPRWKQLAIVYCCSVRWHPPWQSSKISSPTEVTLMNDFACFVATRTGGWRSKALCVNSRWLSNIHFYIDSASLISNKVKFIRRFTWDEVY